MILRFKSTDSAGNRHYLNINTTLEIYTEQPNVMCFTHPIEIKWIDFVHIKKEINFNNYDWSENLYEKPVDIQESYTDPLPCF